MIKKLKWHINPIKKSRYVAIVMALAFIAGPISTFLAPGMASAATYTTAPVNLCYTAQPTLKVGSTHGCVTAVQAFLTYVMAHRVTIDSYYGTQTRNGVEWFQGYTDLNPDDGIVGHDTWTVIKWICNSSETNKERCAARYAYTPWYL